MQWRGAVRVGLFALAGMLTATTAAPTAALADRYDHHGDLSWRCRHGDDNACRIMSDQSWRYYRGGGPYDHGYYDRWGRHHRGWYYDQHGRRYHD